MAIAQEITITLGPDEIGENEGWTITVSVQNDQLKSYDNFPDIEGFRKRGTSSQVTTSIVNGQVSSSQSVVMTYLPIRQGTITVPSFSMTVNGKPFSVSGKKVKVGPPVQRRDPFDFFNRRPAPDDFFGNGATEFVDIKDEAFLAVTTSKDEVYVGEGFNMTLSFFVAESNRAPLKFYDVGKQLSDILKKLKPNNCWEENFNIENIAGTPVTIQGKDYTQYKIYQATYYPLNSEDIQFPSVGMEFIKYKVAKTPSYFGRERKEDFKTFYTKAKKVKVKELPPHPLKDAVAVGNYQLYEHMPTTDVETGKSVSYVFNIFGEGNISAIDRPTVKKDDNFEFYEPNVRQDITRANGRVTGTKSFNYFLIPKEPGTYKLSDYFRWIFFNTEKDRYDTLQSRLTLYVTGESKKNQVIQANDAGTFYDKMQNSDNELRRLDDTDWITTGIGLFTVLIFGASVYLVAKKP